MKSWVLAGCCLGVMLGGSVLGPAEAQKPAPKKYFTGRIAPKNLDQMRRRSVLIHGPKLKKLPKITAPTWDCRTLGLVPPIVDQGQCGSCWDFSGTSVCTSALIKAGFGKADGSFALSEQYTLDCGQNGGCDGDDNTTVTAWAKTKGLPTTADYGPYQASAGSCKSGVKLYQIADWGFCTTTDQQGVAATQDIKNAMVAYGPIGSGIDASVLGDGTGIVSGGGSSIDHDIVLVGWDDTKGSKGCWILRNSWGTSWGVQGYCWIEYGAGSVGTEAIWAVGPGSPPPGPGAPVITSPNVAVGVVGAPFSYQIVASNTPTVYGAAGLPSGLTVSPTTGLVSGSPAIAGVSSVTLSAANASGSGSAPLVVTVTLTPGPTNPVQIMLTPDQIQSVISQSGAITISPTMTLRELLDALEKVKARQKEPPLKSSAVRPQTWNVSERGWKLVKGEKR